MLEQNRNENKSPNSWSSKRLALQTADKFILQEILKKVTITQIFKEIKLQQISSIHQNNTLISENTSISKYRHT